MDEKKTWIGALLSHRQVVPRWHSPQSALHGGERDSSKSTLKPRVLPRRWLPLLQEQAELAQAHPHSSVELEEIRFVLGLPRDMDLAPELVALQRARQVWQRATEHAGTQPPPRPIDDNWVAQERNNVHSMRVALARYPQQALLWSELAHAYIVLGEDEKAKRAMGCAVQLAGRSAYVRRSAARMFLHLHPDDPTHALKVVREHPNFRGDPRMLSAEIAIASRSGFPLRFAKHGLQMLDDANYRPAHLSELAAALGTVELEGGKHKRSRALFARSLREPSENTLAQIQWATEHDDRIVVPNEAWSVARPYEAQALAARFAGDWNEVLTATELWQQEEPFAKRPAELGSFAVFSHEQVIRAERLATRALLANPASVGLLNNRAVARAYFGDLAGALGDVNKASVGCNAAIHPYLVATAGLIGYRRGDHELGALGYSKALEYFVKQKNAPSAVLASLFWIRELARIGDPAVAADLAYIKQHMLRFTRGKPQPEIESMLSLLERTLAQSELPLPVTSGNVDSETRAVYAQLESGQEAVDLRRWHFFDHL